jgi:hypothetical protein
MIASRRDLLKALAAGPLLLAWQRPAVEAEAERKRQKLTTVNGVVFGVETFSFHDLPSSGDAQLIPTIIKNLQSLGIAECEIMSGHVEPFASVMTGWWVQSRRSSDFARRREEARQWRLTVPMSYYRDIRRRFEDAGLRIHLYNVNFNETFTDAERDRTFDAARELGAEGFSSSTVLSEAQRLVPFVQKHKMFVAMHNHNNLVDPDQFATPASFEKALAMSPQFYVTLDIGHFTAGNNDAVAFIRQLTEKVHVSGEIDEQARFRELSGLADTPAGDRTAGEAYFNAAGNCRSCHSVTGDLAAIGRKYDTATLRARLLRPGPTMPREDVSLNSGQAAHLKLLENYTAANVRDLVAYLGASR